MTITQKYLEVYENTKYEPNVNITNSKYFKFKAKITGKIPTVGKTNHFEVIVQLKYLGDFWRTLEMPLTECEINFILPWSYLPSVNSVNPR